MTPSTFAALEGFVSPEARKKRLGQYFSGLPVAKLLVALAAHRKVETVCDPMGGRGDMLLAASQVIPACNRLDGIEIDPLAHGECQAVLRGCAAESTYLLGNAFDEALVSGLAMDGYDLVATNPAYVRYQSQKLSAGAASKLPSALEVRNGLRRCLSVVRTLTDEDRRDFLTLAESYSGLSDLAVPAWILCAALVKPGGTLAMVLPEAWLNRDYSVVVRYLLLRWFQVEYIVEDAHAAWFTDAQVKTTLLVARRINRKVSFRDWADETYLHVALPSRLASDTSLLGRSAIAGSEQPEVAFARRVRAVAKGRAESLVEGADWHRVRIADHAASIAHMAGRDAWFEALESGYSGGVPAGCAVPPVLAPWFAGLDRLTTLGELGVEIGQGLRTGANDFFYADALSRNKSQVLVQSALVEQEKFQLPSACALAVVRRQSDIRDSLSVDAASLGGVVLAFHGWALPEDAAAANAKALPPQAAEYVRRAAKAKVGAKLLPTLSAVAPNARKPNRRLGTPARFWYMLPDFAPRHLPDLFVARVNSETPKVVLNPDRAVLVDANFSTLWLKAGAQVSATAVFAYLNSSLAAALFEHSGAVMGGGALKLEAAHLRTLPVPTLSKAEWTTLGRLGKKLSTAAHAKRGTVLKEIDWMLCEALFCSEQKSRKLCELQTTINNKQAARAKTHDSARSRSNPATG